MKQRSFNLHGVLIVEDEKGGFYSEIVYNPDKKSGLGSMISKQKTPMDYMEGVITNHRCNYEKERGSKKVKSYNLLGKITGRWTQEMKIDDKLYWKRDEEPLFRLQYATNPLESDATNRLDLITLKEKKVEEAGKMKELGEQQQRYDRKLREKAAEKARKKSKVGTS